MKTVRVRIIARSALIPTRGDLGGVLLVQDETEVAKNPLFWVVSGIYFCDTEEDAKLLQAIRETDEMFDYGYGYDDHSDLEDEPVIVHRPIGPEDTDMCDEKQSIDLEGDAKNLEEILEREDADDEENETIRSALELIRSRIQSGKKELGFLFIYGE